ncbi:MAG TPA: RNA-guided pseudouridylation complex pseudouridine synthase subunit Cbf5 [Candidatus Nanoarchaeia archaeon]|nr:RNA-guided pseudouridylation complex pseudouridine synthase subunit Cbf5 [Candidatus Nanoarchaeia archaeon]
MEIDLEEIKQRKTTKELLEFGIINIDKPSGPTSFSVSEFVKDTLELRKTSHFGTLDPKVTGVLPIALNRACKFTGFFLGEDKEYVGIMRIHEDISLENIRKMIKTKFLGEITQLPPKKSRVKRQERQREIKSFELIEKYEKDILFKSEVEGGTYIRKLIHDLGQELNVGAHMLELRRIRAGIFNEDNKYYPSVNLYDFEKAVKEYKNGNEELLRKMIIPAEIICKLYPVVKIKKDNLKQIFTGKPIFNKDILEKPKIDKGEKIVVFSEDNDLIGVYEVLDKENIFAKAEYVLQPIKQK